MEETDAQQQPYWSELQEISRPARERRRLPPEVRSQIIVRLCRVAPLSVKDLSILLDRSEAYVGDAIRPLVTTSELTFLYPDQPRHPRQKYIAGRHHAPEHLPVEIDIPDDVDSLPPDYDDRVDFPVLEAQRSADMPRTHAPRSPRTVVEPEPPPPALPNQATNLAYVAVIGVVLGVASISTWWVWAAIAAAALSALHLVTNSVQYRQFTALRFVRSKRTGFLGLKSAVAFLEIVVVYAIVRVLLGAD